MAAIESVSYSKCGFTPSDPANNIKVIAFLNSGVTGEMSFWKI